MPVNSGLKYVWLERLGAGSYASVYKGRNTVTKELVALKDTRVGDNDLAAVAAREAVILERLGNHPNVVKLQDVFNADSKGNPRWVLVFEFADIGDLRYFMNKTCGTSPLDRHLARSFMWQAMRALEYIHARGVVHRDIKPQNFLVNSNGRLWLADFGLAKMGSIEANPFTDDIASLWYRPPECFLGSCRHDASVDIWGAGCVLAEMMLGEPPFTGMTARAQVNRICDVIGTPDMEERKRMKMKDPSINSAPFDRAPRGPILDRLPVLRKYNEHAVHFLGKLLCFEPAKRYTARTALKHSYFFINE